MSKVEDELKLFGLSIRESDDPNREKIDFTIEDSNDNVCWVWGDTLADAQWECWHPAVEFGNPDELGECKLCGSHCAWHYEEDDEGNKVPTPHQWFELKELRGIIRKIVEERG